MFQKLHGNFTKFHIQCHIFNLCKDYFEVYKDHKKLRQFEVHSYLEANSSFLDVQLNQLEVYKVDNAENCEVRHQDHRNQSCASELFVTGNDSNDVDIGYLCTNDDMESKVLGTV